MLAKLPGEELAKKIWETVIDNGLGGLLKPLQTRRVGRAAIDVQVEAKLRIAQAERNAEAIKNGEATLVGDSTLKLTYNKAQENRSSKVTESTPIIQNVSAALMVDAVRKEINVAKAVLCAEAAAKENEGNISKEAVNSDWLFQWRDNAGRVSNSELQTLWGRILAGEVKSPGAFSLRTLEFLKNTSQQEAEEIARLVPYVINGVIWRNEELERKELPYGYMLKMQELGIVSGVETAGLTKTINSTKTTNFAVPLLGADRALLVYHDDPKKNLVLRCYKLTSIGAEIMKLCSAASNKDYLRNLGNEIVKNGFKVLIASYRENGDQGIEYQTEEEITLPEKTKLSA